MTIQIMTSAVVSEEQVLTSSMHKLQVSIMRGDHAQDDDNQSEATEVTCKTPTCSLPPPQLQEPPRSAPPLRKRMPPRGGGRAAAAAVPRKARPPSIFQNATILRAPPKQRNMPILKTTTAGNADNDDDTSMSLDLRSKPGVIGFFAQAEEDFENFHEVDDDDHLDALHDFHQSHNSGGTSSTTRPTSSCGALSNSTAGHSSSGGTCTCCSSPKRNSPPTTAAMEPLTEERVRAFLRDYYEDFDSIFRLGKSTKAVWDSFFAQYFTPEIRWVRSSSNSLTGPELADHFAKDIVGIRMKLVSIDSLQILTLGVSAVVTFTADQMFEYRGTPNSDRTVLTMVLNVVHGNEIRIAHEHRCTGVPIPPDATWD